MVWELTKRNISVFMRNRRAVFFSFLSTLLVIALYMLFLGSFQASCIKGVFNTYNIAVQEVSVRRFVDAWIISGLLAVNAVTLSLGVLGTMIFDAESKRLTDFLVSPTSRTGIVLGYLFATWIVGVALSLVGLLAGELVIAAGGGEFVDVLGLLKILGIISLSVVCASSVMYFIASLLKSQHGFVSLSTVIGMVIGFTSGLYVPQGVLPEVMQKVTICVPFTDSAAMLRQVLCGGPLAALLRDTPPAAVAEVSRLYGVHLFWGNSEIAGMAMLGILAGAAVLFAALSTLRMRSYKQA